MRVLLVPAAFALLAIGWNFSRRPPARQSRPQHWMTVAAGALTAGLWLAPIGLAFLSGHLTFTYGTLGFNPEFKRAVPIVALLLAAGFLFGVEPALRASRWPGQTRIAAGAAILLGLALSRRAGAAEGWHWALAVWEAGWLWLTVDAIGRRWPGGYGAALPAAVGMVVRLYALSRFDGPFETLGHMVASDGFHVLAQGLWPALIGLGWTITVRQRSGGPQTGRRSGR